MKIHTFKIEKEINQVQTVLYPTILTVNNKNILIDVGYKETFSDFIKEIEELKITTIHEIYISHDDIDHIGALFLFKEKYPEVKIFASKLEEPSISGRVKSERLVQAENSLESIPEEFKG